MAMPSCAIDDIVRIMPLVEPRAQKQLSQIVLATQKINNFFFAGSCMAQRNSLSGRSPFCQLVEVKKGSSAMMISTSSAFKQQKPEETQDKPRERKKTASQRVSEATA